MVSAKNALDIHLSFETFLCHRKYFKTAKIVLILKIYKFCGAIVQYSRPVTFKVLIDIQIITTKSKSNILNHI